jgi:hypothetical protein
VGVQRRKLATAMRCRFDCASRTWGAADLRGIVAAVSRTRFDRAGKDLLRASLEPDGPFESDAEVSPETQRADAWFTPDPERPATRRDLGLLYRLTETACLLEPFHAAPGEDEAGECVRKVLNFRHVLSLRDPAPPLPVLWILSAGRPSSAIEAFGLQPADGWPVGVYRAPRGLHAGLVAVSELPRTRETLLLRLMGAGRVFREAVAELAALPPEARESALARPVLLRYRLEITQAPGKRTSEDEEFVMSTLDIVAEWEREKEANGFRRGRETGIIECLIDLYRARFGSMPEDLQRLVEATHDPETVRGWCTLLLTATPESFAQALRDARH